MIIRIVKMTFQEGRTKEFEAIFESGKQRIRSFEGCSHVELMRDANEPRRYFTYSYWRDEQALNAYRDSDFFKETWDKTKVLFSEKPEAWSLGRVSAA